MGFLKFVFAAVFCIIVTVSAHVKDPLSDESHYKDDGGHNVEYDHDAFLGKDEAVHYKDLTPSQSKKRLQELVANSIDKDKDGKVTEQELKNHVFGIQQKSVDEDVNRGWELFRKRIENDKLTWDEYYDAVYGIQESGKEMPQHYKDSLERDKKRWKVADVDGDTAFTKKEYSCFLHPESCKHMGEVVVLETTSYIDSNKDGYIDLDEYIGQWWKKENNPENPNPPEWVEREKQNFKEHRDADKDGKLNLSELTEWIQPSSEDRVDAEIKHLMAVADDNKDGYLTLAEILNHYDHFVGSQATDYGEQLRRHEEL